MHHKTALTFAAALLVAVSGFCADPPKLVSLKQTYEVEIGKVDDAHGAKLERLHATYARALDKALAVLKKKGDPDAVLQALTEKRRFEEEKTVPAEANGALPPLLQDVRASYRRAVGKVDAETAQAVARTTSSYIAALDRLMKSLTARGKLDLALNVKEEKERVDFILADMPVPQPPPIVPARATPTAQPKPRRVPKAPEVASPTLVIWNTHNWNANDRGTKECSIHLYRGTRKVWSKEDVELTWKAGADCKDSIALPAVKFDRIRIEITKWYGRGGGLAEIKLLRDDDEIALSRKVKASSTFDDRFKAGSVTDGIVTSGSGFHGYWLLRSDKSGWVDVRLDE
jgi:hypothetical protein